MLSLFRFTGTVAIAATLPFTTASGALANAAPKNEGLASLGSANSNEERSSGLIAEAHSAEVNESRNLLSVTWSIENKGDSDVRFNWPTGASYNYSDRSYFSGVTATSEQGGTRFHPIMDGSGECLCSGVTNFDFKDLIKPGEQVAYWSMYSVPEDVDTITLEIPGFEPIEDIPIS